jgi:translation initiation factor 1A
LGKKKREGKKRSQTHDGEKVRVRLPKEGEVLGQIVQILGGGLLQVRCIDEKVRQVMIPGKYRKRMWCRVGDIIALTPLYGMDPDRKGTLEYRYSNNEALTLHDMDLIPEEYVM